VAVAQLTTIPVALTERRVMRSSRASQYAGPLASSLLLSASMIAGRVLLAQGATPAAPQAGDNYMVCWSTGEHVAYFSEIFVAPPPPRGPRGRQGNQLGETFAAYLKTKYSLPATDHAICGGPPAATLQKTQSYKQQMEDKIKQEKKQVVETTWKYTP
jgi:hypothetical protein